MTIFNLFIAFLTLTIISTKCKDIPTILSEASSSFTLYDLCPKIECKHQLKDRCVQLLQEPGTQNTDVLDGWLITNNSYDGSGDGFTSGTTAQYLLYIDDICKRNELCEVNLEFSGVCESITNLIIPTPIYPGDTCDDLDPYTRCAFATKNCKSGKCEGIAMGESCGETGDCKTGFCRQGLCAEFTVIGGSCSHIHECGRTAYCAKNYNSISGICIEYSTINVGAYVDIQSPLTNRVPSTDISLLCKSGYQHNGYCSTPPRSLRMGEICTSSADCPSDAIGVIAECKCAFSTNGVKICDILEGDELWIDARQYFMEYYEGTKECNPGSKWGQCSKAQKYHKWKCAEYKAEYYTLTALGFENFECYDVLQQDLPIFKEIYQHCKKAGAKFINISGIVILVLIYIIL